jgi:universal stress protein A
VTTLIDEPRLYQKILAVLDLGPDSLHVGMRARTVAAATGAAVSFLHVVDYVPIEPIGEILLPTCEVEQDLICKSEIRLREIIEDIGLANAQMFVTSGNKKREIVRIATAIGSDLIVIGSHKRHGPSIFFNLTEDTVLHTSPCDVLAVRVR